MMFKTLIGNPDESPIEPALLYSSFVSSDQQDGASFRVEREGYSPHTITCIEAHFLHICVPGSLQCIDVGASELWAKYFK